MGPGRNQEVKKDGGGDVIGNVPHDLQLRHPLGQICSSYFKDVFADHPYPWDSPIGSLQVGRQIPIQFHQEEAPAAAHQVLSEGPFSRPDLQNFIGRPEVQGFNDLSLEISVYQEILAE